MKNSLLGIFSAYIPSLKAKPEVCMKMLQVINLPEVENLSPWISVALRYGFMRSDMSKYCPLGGGSVPAVLCIQALSLAQI